MLATYTSSRELYIAIKYKCSSTFIGSQDQKKKCTKYT